jgi:hypothetical protein
VKQLRYYTVVESTGVLIGFYLPCERTSLGPIITGIVLRNDLTWSSNTAYKKLWMVRRLKVQGAKYEDLKDVYIKQVRSTLEFVVSVWNCGVTQGELADIE